MPLTVVAAPPGYGKTTLLAEWSQRHPSRFAWLSIDRHDNDLARLVSYTAAALERVDPIGSEVRRPDGRYSVATAAYTVAAAMSGMNEPVVLVLDHVEALQNDECLDTIAELALHLPDGARLALGTRAEPPLPMARLHAGRTSWRSESGARDDGARGTRAARRRWRAAHRRRDGRVARPDRRLAGRAVSRSPGTEGRRSSEHAGLPFSGDDRLIAEYLRTGLLARLSHAEVTFLTRTAVLDRMSGRLCDAVLDTSGSSVVLESLAHSNMLLVGLDRQGEWYRYHHLFRDLLRAELHRREPELVSALYVRAADWCEANRMPELAIDYAQAGGDAPRVNRLVLRNVQRSFAAGRSETVRRWLAWFEVEDLVEQDPAVVLMGALFYINVGDAAAAERWTLAAEEPAAESPVDQDSSASHEVPEPRLPDGSTLTALRAVLRGFQCRNGIDEMQRDVQNALEGLSPGSALRGPVLVRARIFVPHGRRPGTSGRELCRGGGTL